MESSPELMLAVEAALKAGEVILDVYERECIDVEMKADDSPVTEADREANRVICDILRLSGAFVISEEAEVLSYEDRQKWGALWVVDPLDGTREFLKRNDEFTVNIALLDYDTPKLGVIYAPALGKMYVCSELYGPWFVADVHDALRSEEGFFSGAKRLPFEQERRPFRVVASRSHMDGMTRRYIDGLREEHPDLEVVQVGSSLKLAMVASGEADVYVRYGRTMEWDTAAGHAILNASGCELVTLDLGMDLVYNKKEMDNPPFIARRKGGWRQAQSGDQ
ncbi:MAG: 3'(2'),5'-bisphosphate nucleotidase CysQ [Prosthecochloris sp.]|nr:3'(2'),5'-bisphosphate nucleotidase CysQ [Prosthecochloris sp.]